MNYAGTSIRGGTTRVGGAALRIAGLLKRYGNSSAAAVDGISLDVAAGEFVSLLGRLRFRQDDDSDDGCRIHASQ